MFEFHRNVEKLYAMKVARTVWERVKDRGTNIRVLPIHIILDAFIIFSTQKDEYIIKKMKRCVSNDINVKKVY